MQRERERDTALKDGELARRERDFVCSLSLSRFGLVLFALVFACEQSLAKMVLPALSLSFALARPCYRQRLRAFQVLERGKCVYCLPANWRRPTLRPRKSASVLVVSVNFNAKQRFISRSFPASELASDIKRPKWGPIKGLARRRQI